MSALRVQTHQHNGCPLFKLIGNLNLAARETLRESIELVWNASLHLRLDLAQVHTVDLLGLSWLVLADGHLRQRGGQLEITALSQAVSQGLRMFWPATRDLVLTPFPGIVNPKRERIGSLCLSDRFAGSPVRS